MIELEAPQGSAAWDAAHLGIITSRHVGRLITNSWNLSAPATRDKLLCELVAEWATGQPWADWKGNIWTERGEQLEPEALAYYVALRDSTTDNMRRPSLIYKDGFDGFVATTPDWLVGERGNCVEVKCCATPQHLADVLRCEAGYCPPEYMRQCQWHMWVTGAEWCDVLAYSDAVPLQGLVRVEPSIAAFSAFEKYIPDAVDLILEKREKLISLGLEPAKLSAAMDPNAAYLESWG